MKLNFNQGWKFALGNIPDAISPDYDMAQLKRWENVNLPHTIRLEPVFGSESNPTLQAQCMYVKRFPIAKDMLGKKLYLEFEGVMGVTDVWVNGELMHTALADHAPTSETEVNTNYGGYLPFIVDITDCVKYDGSDNVVTVLTDNLDHGDVPPGKPQSQLDFTYFGGIYRNAWLKVTDRIHITDAVFENIEAGGGIMVEYPEITDKSALVSVKTHARNESGEEKTVTLRTELLNREGVKVAEASSDEILTPNGEFTFRQILPVFEPHLWNLDDPYLHTLVSTLSVAGKETDSVKTVIGIRKIEIDRAVGVIINGKKAPLLSGGNRHQDYPVIGNAAPDSLQYRDAVKFKEAGFNIVRAAHYPMSNEFVRGCNELGLLLYEAVPGWQWYPATEVFDVRVRDQLRQLVRRDRNHPCMFAYETVLNEAYNVPKDYTRISSKVVLAEQPSALIATESQGYSVEDNGLDELADIMFGHPESEALTKSVKALGFVREYGDSWVEDHGTFHGRRISRGKREETGEYYPGGEGRMLQQANNRLWDRDSKRGLEGGYAGRTESLLNKYQNRQNNIAYVGGTMWTAQDNRGYGSKMSLTGIWDCYRLPKFAYYAFESQRHVEHDAYLESKGVKTGPMLFIASYWNEKAPDIDVALYNEKPVGTDSEREIYVYSNAERVLLTVEKDGEILWSEEHSPLTNEQYEDIELLPHPPFEFLNVPFVKGSSLKAVGFDKNGEEIASQEIKTAGTPCKLKLEADYAGVGLTADGSDLIRVFAYVLDDEGTVCNSAVNEIKFSVNGGASVVGDGIKRAGANPAKAEAGIATVYVKAPMVAGTLTVTAESEGLLSGEIEIEAYPMTQKAAEYTYVEREGADMSNSSMFLTLKEMRFEGNVKIVDENIVSENAYAEYDIGGAYQRFTAHTKGEAVFKIYADGVLKALIENAGEADVDISGAKTLRLETIGKGAFIAPYIYEGTALEDNGELYSENLAFGKAVSATNGEGEALVTDGDSETMWQGDVFDGKEQSVTIDLGESFNIRNTKIELGVDNTTYGYDVYTSKDGKAWEKKACAERTGWTNASGYLDKFTAEARFVRVTFTNVSDGLPAALREVSVYRDFGVECVSEYNLKGIAIDGCDIVFSSDKTEYEVKASGELTVYALACDDDAAVAINGKEVINPKGIANLNEANAVTVSPDENGEIKIEVTPKSGYGKKVYTIKVK